MAGRAVIRSVVSLCILGVLAGAAQAEIRETTSMEEAFRSVDGDTLLVLDTDNTILKARQMLGNEAWVPYIIKKLTIEGMAEGLSREAAEERAFDRAFTVWKGAHRPDGVELVEDAVAHLVANAQAGGARVMVLSGTVSSFMDGRRAELASLGLDFSRAAPAHGAFELAPFVAYEEGILLTTFQDKGVALSALFARLNWRPRRVVFIDDLALFTSQVDRAMTALGTQVLCFRYGAADGMYAAFEPRVADIQLAEFLATGKLLSDDEARRRLPPLRPARR